MTSNMDESSVEQANVTVLFAPRVTQLPVPDAAPLNLRVELKIGGASFAAHRPLLRFKTEQFSVKLPAYAEDSFRGQDDRGDLALSWQSTDGGQQWSPSRETEGDVKISFDAVYTSPTRTTRAGPYMDFRLTNGCLIGTGFGFIPEILAKKVTVEQLTFDLESVQDISAAWTHGEVSAGNKTTFPFDNEKDILQSLVFGFGKLRSVSGQDSGRTSYHAYWAQDDPAHKDLNLQELAEKAGAVFDTVATTLTPESARPELRMFVVENPYASNGASALPNAYIVGHSSVLPRPLTHFVSLVAHEAVHLFLSMDPKDGESAESVAWWNEGIAEYYAYMLSWKHSLYGEADVLESLNSAIQAYFTSPAIEWNNDRCAEKFWDDTCAQTQIYGRGLLFFLLLDDLIRGNKQEGAKYTCLHDVICDFQGITTGKPVAGICASDFLALLDSTLGSEVHDLYQCMMRGDPIRLRDKALASSWGLESRMKELEVFDLGFSESCFQDATQPLEKLDPNSRAAEAGLREGDLILKHTPLYEGIDSVENSLKVTVQRPTANGHGEGSVDQTRMTNGDGKEIFEVTFLPRGRAKIATPQFQVVKPKDDAPHGDLK